MLAIGLGAHSWFSRYPPCLPLPPLTIASVFRLGISVRAAGESISRLRGVARAGRLHRIHGAAIRLAHTPAVCPRTGRLWIVFNISRPGESGYGYPEAAGFVLSSQEQARDDLLARYAERVSIACLSASRMGEARFNAVTYAQRRRGIGDHQKRRVSESPEPYADVGL